MSFEKFQSLLKQSFYSSESIYVYAPQRNQSHTPVPIYIFASDLAVPRRAGTDEPERERAREFDFLLKELTTITPEVTRSGRMEWKLKIEMNVKCR